MHYGRPWLPVAAETRGFQEDLDGPVSAGHDTGVDHNFSFVAEFDTSPCVLNRLHTLHHYHR